MASQARTVAPFLRRGVSDSGMMGAMLVVLSLLALHFGIRYDLQFLFRYPLYIAVALALELVYHLLNEGRWKAPRSSTAVTAALLVLSVPAHLSSLAVCTGLFVALFFGKFTVGGRALRLNPMLLGRLAIMLLFAGPVQVWLRPGVEIDAFSAATPLGLFMSEEITWPLSKLAFGQLHGSWEGVVSIIPGSPGEVMPLLSLLGAVVLYVMGVLDWRPGLAYLGGMALASAYFDLPVAFSLLAGSTLFTAAFIITDPGSTASSRFGRWVSGFLAGVINAGIRSYGYYPEGVVFAVLTVNLMSPALDRIAFRFRGLRLSHRS